MYFQLDKATQDTLREMNSPFEGISSARTDEQVNDAIEQDQNFQRDFARQRLAPQVDAALAEEIYSILTEIEGDAGRFEYSGQERYINWETTDISYKVLRRAGATEPARLIKNKRRFDFAQYASPPAADGVQRGCKLTFIDDDYSPTKEEKKKLKIWEQQVFLNFFFSAQDKSPSFTKFIGNAYEDYFDVDDITYEVLRNGIGDPISIHLSDPMLWKPVIKKRKSAFSIYDDDILSGVLNDYEEMLFGENAFFFNAEEEPDYLLVYDQRRIMHAFRDTVKKHHFFTRSDFRRAQRGFSIVEQGLNLMTWIIQSLRLNASNFSGNQIPQGLLLFTGGGISHLQLEKLKKVLRAHTSGPQNNNRFPLASLRGEKGDGKWINFRGTSREMEYHLWMTLLFSIFCQLSGTDPREISLGAHADAIKNQSLSSENTDGIIKESKDVGAVTFLKYLENALNEPNKSGKNIFEELTKLPVKMRFVGFEIQDKKAKYEITQKELATVKSRNDKLAEEDQEKFTLMIDLGGEEGKINYFDIPGSESNQLHQIIMGKIQQQAQVQMQQQQMQMQQAQAGGQPGEGEGDQLTDADRELLQQYGDKEDVNVDDKLKAELNGEEEQ